MRPKVPVKSQGICSTCDVITFDQKHRLYPSYGVGRDLSNVIQTSPIRLMYMQLEICTKTFYNLGKKLSGKFPLFTLCLSMASISCLRAWLMLSRKFLNSKEGWQKANNCSKKIGRREKRKAKREIKMKSLKWWDGLSPQNFDFCACLRKKVVKCASSEMQGCVLRFKCGFD